MSYGVVAKKPAEVRVELAPTARPSADRAARRLSRGPEDLPWGTGLLTLTSHHLSFNPTSASVVGALTIALADVVAVEPGPGRIRKTVCIRTAELVLHARVTGVAAFITRVSASVDNSRKSGSPRPVDLDAPGEATPNPPFSPAG